MSIQVTFIRHGKTAGNLRGAYIGRTDEPLCPEGISILRENQKAGFYPAEPGILLASPMKRCVETAELLFPSEEIRTVSDFRETDFGEFEGKSYEDLNGNPDYQRWIDSGGSIAFPRGESPEDFKKRCAAAFLETMKEIPEDAFVTIVCHGGAIMAILDAFSHPHGDFYNWQAKNGGGFRCRYDPETGRLEHITPLGDRRN